MTRDVPAGSVAAGVPARVLCHGRGHGAVVGTGAVVRGEVPPGQVWSGNPARFVRALTLAAPRAPVRPAVAAEAVR